MATQIENETVALHPVPLFIQSHPLSSPTLQVRGRTLSARLEIKTARITGLAFSKFHVRDSPGLLHPSLFPSTRGCDSQAAWAALTVIRIAAHRLIRFFLLCP